jgi:hypothetical protein
MLCVNIKISCNLINFKYVLTYCLYIFLCYVSALSTNTNTADSISSISVLLLTLNLSFGIHNIMYSILVSKHVFVSNLRCYLNSICVFDNIVSYFSVQTEEATCTIDEQEK